MKKRKKAELTEDKKTSGGVDRQEWVQVNKGMKRN